MNRILLVFINLSVLSAQPPMTPIRSYDTMQEYCRDRPEMPTCYKGKWMGDLPLMKAPTGPPAAAGRAPIFPSPQRQPPKAEVALQDWRFSHPSPAMLVSVNIGSLLQSPVWTILFPAIGAESMGWKPADLEKAKLALSDVGQVLMSLSPNQTASPSVLTLAKGNLDGALAAILRSGAGMQAKRVDPITMLIGDANSLGLASLRMRSATTTGNPLQQTATLEALKYDAWIGIDPRYIASMASTFGAGSNPALGMLGALRSMSIGLYLRDQIRVEASVEAPSPEVAERMLAAYRTEVGKRGEKDTLGGQIWVTTEGAKVRFIEIVDAAKLKGATFLDAATARMIAPQIAPLIQSLAGASPAPAAPRAAAPVPQGGIVIQGLAGGPKQLPAK